MMTVELQKKKSEIQNEAFDKWKEGREGVGTLEMCTGAGKSRVACMAINDLPGKNKVLILVPKINLKDNWKQEIEKWCEDTSSLDIEFECYQSAYKFESRVYDLVIADEVHNGLSDEYIKFFENNSWLQLICLTATVPDDKRDRLEEIAPVVFQYGIDQAVEDGVVSPYKLIAIRHELDNVQKTIKGGSQKTGWFMQTEYKGYQYKDSVVKKSFYQNRKGKYDPVKFATLARARFVYNLPSKILPTKLLVKKLVDEGKRVVIFSEQKDILDQVTDYAIHSGKKDAENAEIKRAFNAGEIPVIASAMKLKEGENLTGVSAVVMMSYNGQPLHFTQKAGRAVRWEEDKQAEIYAFVTKGTPEDESVTNGGAYKPGWFKKMLGAITADVGFIYSSDLIKEYNGND